MSRTPHRTALLLLLAMLVLAALPVLAAEESEGNPNETLFKWINFFTVFGPAIYFGRKPLKAAFDAMRKEIRADIDKSQKQQEDARQRITGVEQRLANLDEETVGMRRTALEEITAQLERLRETARRDTERILATTQAEIESSRRAAGLQLRAHSARLAIQLAEQSLRKKLTPGAHTTLFETFVGSLERRA